MNDATAAVEAPPRRGRRGYFLPGAIALAALLLIGVAVGAGDLSHPAPHTLRGPDVASQISLGVQAQQNSRTAPTVDCPASEPVKQGVTFRCALSTGPGGATRVVTVTEVDGRGNLRWSLAPVGSPAPPK